MSTAISTIDQVRESATNAFDLEQPMHRDEAVFRAIAEILTESGHFTLPEWSPLSIKLGRKTVKAHGYELDEHLDVLTIFHMVDCHEKTDLHAPWAKVSCPPSDLERAIADLEALANAACALGDCGPRPVNPTPPPADAVMPTATVAPPPVTLPPPAPLPEPRPVQTTPVTVPQTAPG